MWTRSNGAPPARQAAPPACRAASAVLPRRATTPDSVLCCGATAHPCDGTVKVKGDDKPMERTTWGIG
eukprot:7316542-Prymnesium_polylepis.1